MIRGVTFDFWNTLIGEYDGARAHRVANVGVVLDDLGEPRTPEEINAVFDDLHGWFDERWLANLVITPELGGTRVADRLGITHVVGADEAIAAVFQRGGEMERLTVAPGIADALASLRANGVRVGIICDTGFAPGATLRRYLEHHDLLQFFDHWSFSNEVGVYKPDPVIFRHAADGLGIDDPAALAHVGDLRRTDIGGASAVGWTAVRYRGLNDDTDEASVDASIVIDHHDQLPAALGLG